MPGVSDGSLAAQTVALLHVEGVVSVRVVPRLQQLPAQIVLLIEGAQQLPLLLSSRQLGHLQEDGEGSDEQSNIWTNIWTNIWPQERVSRARIPGGGFFKDRTST